MCVTTFNKVSGGSGRGWKVFWSSHKSGLDFSCKRYFDGERHSLLLCDWNEAIALPQQSEHLFRKGFCFFKSLEVAKSFAISINIPWQYIILSIDYTEQIGYGVEKINFDGLIVANKIRIYLSEEDRLLPLDVLRTKYSA